MAATLSRFVFLAGTTPRILEVVPRACQLSLPQDDFKKTFEGMQERLPVEVLGPEEMIPSVYVGISSLTARSVYITKPKRTGNMDYRDNLAKVDARMEPSRKTAGLLTILHETCIVTGNLGQLKRLIVDNDRAFEDEPALIERAAYQNKRTLEFLSVETLALTNVLAFGKDFLLFLLYIFPTQSLWKDGYFYDRRIGAGKTTAAVATVEATTFRTDPDMYSRSASTSSPPAPTGSKPPEAIPEDGRPNNGINDHSYQHVPEDQEYTIEDMGTEYPTYGEPEDVETVNQAILYRGGPIVDEEGDELHAELAGLKELTIYHEENLRDGFIRRNLARPTEAVRVMARAGRLFLPKDKKEAPAMKERLVLRAPTDSSLLKGVYIGISAISLQPAFAQPAHTRSNDDWSDTTSGIDVRAEPCRRKCGRNTILHEAATVRGNMGQITRFTLNNGLWQDPVYVLVKGGQLKATGGIVDQAVLGRSPANHQMAGHVDAIRTTAHREKSPSAVFNSFSEFTRFMVQKNPTEWEDIERA
ncbi:hypothetical protein Neosp_011300 [[Neocosmospora] mangrovei]